MTDFSNKVALVTGANSGIGKATAQLFGQAGARVALLGRSEEEIQQTAQEFEQAGYTVMPLVADISQSDAMERAIGQIIEHWQRLDIVFANAGINGVWAPLEDLTPEDWDKTLDVNLKGTFLTVKYAVPHLKKQGGGAVIITSSVNGTRMFSNTGLPRIPVPKLPRLLLLK